MVLLPAGSAFAHDCFIANRGANGAVNAGHGGWFTVDVDADITAWVEAGLVTAEGGDCLMDALPSTIAIKGKGANGNGGVLGTNNPHDAKLADGKGVENAEAYFAACGVEFPEE